jgi:hypothetical protein
MAVTGQAESLGVRLVGLVRSVALGGLAGAITGVVVLGVGGRFVMFVSRLLHPEALGRLTENGNRIGEFTVEGTIELIIFGGLLSGLLAGVVWVLVREWIPKKAALVGLGAVAIGGSFLIQGNNRDFFILQDPSLDLVLLLGLLFLFGIALYWVDGLLDEKMPNQPQTFGIVVYSLMVAMAAPLIIPTFASMFSKDFCFCSNPPIWTGVFLTATSLATIVWWVQHLRGADTPSRTLNTIGTTSVALTAIAGAVDLTTEITRIL